MAEEAMVSVGYEGKQYRIPAEIARLNATQPGVARDYIEEKIAEETYRQQQSKARKEESVEAEFAVVKTRLSELESERAVTKNLQRENVSLKATVEALVTQIAAIESSGNAAGSASAEARQVSYDLSNAAAVAYGALTELRSQNDRLNATVEKMEARLAELELAQAEQITQAMTSGQAQQRLQQEASNRALNEAARAEARAANAGAVAAQALSDAKAAQSLNKNDVTREQIMAMVQNEVRESSPRLVNEAIEVIREDEFHGGSVTGQRHDPALTRQRRDDADQMRNIR